MALPVALNGGMPGSAAGVMIAAALWSLLPWKRIVGAGHHAPCLSVSLDECGGFGKLPYATSPGADAVAMTSLWSIFALWQGRADCGGLRKPPYALLQAPTRSLRRLCDLCVLCGKAGQYSIHALRTSFDNADHRRYTW